jgi:hypothetical protein
MATPPGGFALEDLQRDEPVESAPRTSKPPAKPGKPSK